MIFYPYQFSIHDQDVSRLTALLESVPDDAAILLWSLEFVNHRRLLRLFECVEGLACRDRVFWMLQSTFGYQEILGPYASDRVYLVEQDLWIYHLHMTRWNVLEFSKRWYPDTGKFLFLTGDPDRANRLPLLWKLDQAGLLDHCVWSLFADPNRTEQYHRWVPDQTLDVVRDWVQRRSRSADGNQAQTYLSRKYIGSCDMIDVDLFRGTSFRIISETSDTQPFLTEKTWGTMLNHQPFVMAAAIPGTLELMESMGFRTFRQYLRHPNYDSETDVDRRMQLVVDNVQGLLEHLPPDIEADIEHNYQHTLAIMRDTVTKITELHARLNTTLPLTRLVPIYRDRHRWMEFYYGVRDESWPDCDNEQDFWLLPKEIQQECIEVFGYEPPKVDFVPTKS